MATLLRSRRFADRALEVTRQFVTFPLGQYWYALPIEALQRVSQIPSADVPQAETSQWVDVSLIDLDRWLAPAPDGHTAPLAPQAACVLLFKDATGQTFGLPIDAQPTMQRIAQRQIAPLTDFTTYPAAVATFCSAVIHLEGAEPIFLLDREQLCSPTV